MRALHYTKKILMIMCESLITINFKYFINKIVKLNQLAYFTSSVWFFFFAEKKIQLT